MNLYFFDCGTEYLRKEYDCRYSYIAWNQDQFQFSGKYMYSIFGEM